MLANLPAYLARTDTPFNFDTGNVQQKPPPFAPHLYEDLLLYESIIAVTHALLGDGPHNGFHSGNPAVSGSGQRQPVHADVGQLWPNLAAAHPPFSLVVKIPVVEARRAIRGGTRLVADQCAIESDWRNEIRR